MKKTKPAPKRDPHAGPKTAAYFIQLGIEQYQASLALRHRTGIDLVTLKAVATFRRKLLKQIPKS